MFDGKDYPTQWALNPSAYQNMSNDQGKWYKKYFSIAIHFLPWLCNIYLSYKTFDHHSVDWAALAQQWIKMKETVVPPAPPPPTINPICSGNDGSGEAPMDMDTKEDDVPPAPPAPTISGSGSMRKLIQ